MERECIICWAPPTVRFGCGHSFLCGGEDCLGAWLAEHKPCVPALTPRAQENWLHSCCCIAVRAGLAVDTCLGAMARLDSSFAVFKTQP